MRLLFLSVVAAVLVGSYLLVGNQKTQNPVEQSVALWNDGTDAFYKQVIQGNGGWVENAGFPIFDNQLVASLPQEPTQDKGMSAVLGSHIASDGSEKWIEVDLSDLKLYAWEGNRKVFEFFISTGRPGYNTPTGEFRVWRKVRSQTYRGGSKARDDYYYLPNVPYSLFFAGANIPNWNGYAVHGAYWHNDFGIKNRSSGCVNVLPSEAEQLYSWAGPAMPADVDALNASDDNPGVRVTIHN